MKSIKSSQVLIFVGVLAVIVTVAFSFTKLLRATPPSAPGLSKVLSEPHTIGVLTVGQFKEVVDGMKKELKELGYTNITYKEEWFDVSTASKERVENLAKKLIGEKVDLLYVPGEYWAIWAMSGAQAIGSTVPIVHFSNFHDPVNYGLAKSFLSSGNNATGVATNIIDIIQKQLEFLRKIRPASKKLGVFGTGFGIPAIGGEWLSELKKQAPRLGYEIVEYTINVPPPQAETAFHAVAATVKPGDVDAIYHIGGHYYENQQMAESELAARLQVPMVAPLEDLSTGGHFGYSAEFETAGKQTTKMIDKIFRGIKPSDIPLENAEKISLVVYPARARLAGVEFPESMLSIADKIINDK